MVKVPSTLLSYKFDLLIHHLHLKELYTKHSDWLMLAKYHLVSIYPHLLQNKMTPECTDKLNQKHLALFYPVVYGTSTEYH